VAIIIVAISHELSHGIFARANNVKIKSTGFVFLGPILGAFVEQEDKQMKKRSKVAQMSILGAGVFANIIIAILFFLLLILIFNLMFIPAGAQFSSYSYGVANKSNIISITEQENGLNLIKTIDQDYVLSNMNLDLQIGNDENFIIAHYNAPAINNNLSGAITEINGIRIGNLDDFINEMSKYSPEDEITIKTTEGTYKLTLETHPLDNERGFLGVGFSGNQEFKGLRKVYMKIFGFKKPTTYYQPTSGVASEFLYNLVWWIALINLMVGLFNMLPFAFLDGGRFFYLTVLGITKSKKFSEKAFKYATKFILLLFVALMVVWVLSFI